MCANVLAWSNSVAFLEAFGEIGGCREPHFVHYFIDCQVVLKEIKFRSRQASIPYELDYGHPRECLCTRSKGEEYPFVKAANIEAGTYTLNLDLINFAAPSYTMLM